MKSKLFLSLIALGSISLSGCYLDLGFLKIGTKVEEEGEEEQKPSGEEQGEKEGEGKEGEKETPTDPIEDYYKNYNLKLNGGRLEQELQKMCWDKHTGWVTYSQIQSYYATTSDHLSVDAIKEGSKVNQYFYTGKEATGYVSGSNREHVWPCANSGQLWTHTKPANGGFSPHYVDHSYYVGGGSDLFHVRPCEGNVNTARGNSRFVSFDHPEYIARKDEIVEYGEENGKWTIKLLGATPVGTGYEFASQSEPDDNMKGDIARLILYLYIHYNDRGITPDKEVVKGSSTKYTYKYKDMCGSLPLTNIMGYNDEERCQEVLMEWNELDPVSSIEQLRNNTVQKIQGNRNPFVDYPDLVNKLF